MTFGCSRLIYNDVFLYISQEIMLLELLAIITLYEGTEVQVGVTDHQIRGAFIANACVWHLHFLLHLQALGRTTVVRDLHRWGWWWW